MIEALKKAREVLAVTYRKEWDCCGSVTETEAWEPEHCPICTDDAAPFRKDAERYRWLRDVNNMRARELFRYYGDVDASQLDAAIDDAMLAAPAVGAA